MGHSYIDYGDNYVLLNDDDIVVVLSIALAVSDQLFDSLPYASSPRAKAMFAEWNSLLDTAGPGCFNVDLKRYIQTSECEQYFKTCIITVEHVIRQLGHVVSAETLNKLIRPRVLVIDDRTTDCLLTALTRIRSLFE
jgi:hypothetical protein